MSTQSIIIDGDVSTQYELSDEQSIQTMLERLYDNTDKIIQPQDLRDAIYSVWGNIAFKEYNGYITTDTNKSIVIGNRIYAENLNSDIIMGNTSEPDPDDIIDTKISFLSGDDIMLFSKAPNIVSKVVVGTDDTYLTMDINNPANINIIAQTVSINSYPISGTPNDGATLIFNDGDITISTPVINDYIGTSNSNTSFLGELSVNGFDMEFTDSMRIPTPIGDISAGETFSSFPLSELLRRILYNYQTPNAFLSFEPPFENGYVEVGTYPRPKINYTINKRTLPTLPTGLVNMIPNSHPAITGIGYISEYGIADAIIITPITQATYSYSALTRDGVSTTTNTINLYGIYPMFYGTNINNNLNYLFSLIKIVDNKSNKRVFISGNGYIYFIYPESYGTLVDILDESGASIMSQFDSFTRNFSSPNGFWVNKPFRVYRSNYQNNESDLVEINFNF